jgi:ABC-2 type transport system ATP-binding protein
MPLIEASNIGIEFPVAPPNARSFRHLAIRTASRVGGRVSKNDGAFRFVQALDGVSFTLKQGDRLALFGRNGAGKTTLIRVLAGIYQPTSGSLRVVGRIMPMFDIGLGMDEEASGYENIRIRGLILGLTPDEIEERLPEIAEFAELGDYLELPIRTYSSGMLLRLVFAIATSGSRSATRNSARRRMTGFRRSPHVPASSFSLRMITACCAKPAISQFISKAVACAASVSSKMY